MQQAKNLKPNIKNIPHQGGWYRWLADRESAKQLGIDDKLWGVLSKTFVDEKVLGYIYVGLASSLKNRMNDHIRGNIEGSTFRKSISSILSDWDKTRVADFIDNLYVEYFVEPCSTCRVIIEQSEMKTKVLPLNVDDNVNQESLKDFILELKSKRKILTNVKK